MGRQFRVAISAICATVVTSAALAGVAATPATATPAAEETVTTLAEAYCDVTVNLVTQWSTGYGIVLSIRNISNVPVRWRQIQLTFQGAISSAQVWNVSYTQSGQQATLVPLPSSGVLNPGQMVTIGIINALGSPNTLPQREVICTPA